MFVYKGYFHSQLYYIKYFYPKHIYLHTVVFFQVFLNKTNENIDWIISFNNSYLFVHSYIVSSNNKEL